MSNIVHLNKQPESISEKPKVDLDENLKVIVRQLARQAAKEYFESYQALESKREGFATSDIDKQEQAGV